MTAPAQDAVAPALRSETRKRNAVVLSGGGANGAYEVGVLKALFEGASPATGHLPLAAQIYAGTSVGAYNAAFLAQAPSTERETLGWLEEIWRQRIADTPASCGNGIYRLRADPTRFLDPGCLRHPLELLAGSAMDAAFWLRYGIERTAFFLSSDEPVRVKALQTIDFAALFSEAPLAALLAETIDLAMLASSPKALTVVATDWYNGRPRLFDKADIVERYGRDAILASTAIPGVFPPVELDGTPYVDGGLMMNTPLKPAIDAGAEVLHVIYVDPRVSDIPYPELPNTLDTVYRSYVIVVADNMNHDIVTAELVNEDQELAAQLGLVREGGPVRGAAPGLRRLRRVVDHVQRGEPYRPITIHRYRPQLPLSSADGLLDFDGRRIDALIALGYEDAVHHDCGEARCILPPDLALRPGAGAAAVSGLALEEKTV